MMAVLASLPAVAQRPQRPSPISDKNRLESFIDTSFVIITPDSGIWRPKLRYRDGTEVTSTVLATPTIFDMRPEHMTVRPTRADDLLAFARTYLGRRYHSRCPYTGIAMDCSGYVTAVFLHYGITLPRSSADMWAGLPHVSWQEARPGDLVLFNGHRKGGRIGHVGIIVSIDAEHKNYYFIHASNSRGIVIEAYQGNPYFYSRFKGFARPPLK